MLSTWAVAGAAPEDVEGSGGTVGAELAVGVEVGLGVGVEDVFAGVAGDLVGGGNPGAEPSGEGAAVADLGG